MKKVITQKKTDTIDLVDLIKRLGKGDELIVTYKAKSDLPYFTYLSMTSHGHYGFRSPLGLRNKMTYMHPSLEACLDSAIGGGKELLVFERNEMNNFFKLM
jgi:hypothetical protein